MNPLVAFLSMLALLPVVLLLAWLEATLDADDYGQGPRYREPEPKRNTWPDGEA